MEAPTFKLFAFCATLPGMGTLSEYLSTRARAGTKVKVLVYLMVPGFTSGRGTFSFPILSKAVKTQALWPTAKSRCSHSI